MLLVTCDPSPELRALLARLLREEKGQGISYDGRRLLIEEVDLHGATETWQEKGFALGCVLEPQQSSFVVTPSQKCSGNTHPWTSHSTYREAADASHWKRAEALVVHMTAIEQSRDRGFDHRCFGCQIPVAAIHRVLGGMTPPDQSVVGQGV